MHACIHVSTEEKLPGKPSLWGQDLCIGLLKIGTGGWTACGAVCLPMEEPSELLAGDTCPVEVSGEVDTMHLHSKKERKREDQRHCSSHKERNGIEMITHAATTTNTQCRFLRSRKVRVNPGRGWSSLYLPGSICHWGQKGRGQCINLHAN